MAEQIYKQHHHRKHHDVAQFVEVTAGGPDDITSELQIETTEVIGKIAHVLGEISVRAD